MKKLSMILVCSAIALFLAAGSAGAAVFGPDNGAALQGVLDDITLAPTAGQSSVDVLTDDVADSFDSYWDITATGGSVSTLVVELAAFAPDNVFGIFDSSNPMNKVTVFAGSAGSGAMATISITSVGDVYLNHADTGIDFGATTFGYFLDSSFYANGGFWYSDTSLNNDSMDHMYAYQGKDIDTVQLGPWAPGLWTSNEYVLAFEDLGFNASSDGDYTDMVLMVESVQPVPIPAAVLLFGSGLFGLIGIRRKVR